MNFTNFYKYQGTGNDFIIFDNRDGKCDDFSSEMIEKLCNRRFGIGADGLMFLNKSENYDFKMRYFNSDGNEGSMCGNGGRCIVAFAKKLGVISEKTQFEAIDGIHFAEFTDENIVKLKMNDVAEIQQQNNDFILNTGSPHFVRFVENVEQVDVFNEGRKIRYSEQFPKGINVNFVQIISENEIYVRTYERGVEEETLSCGTGVTAASIASFFKTKNQKFNIKTKGGNLRTQFEIENQNFHNVWLEGKAEFVFIGEI